MALSNKTDDTVRNDMGERIFGINALKQVKSSEEQTCALQESTIINVTKRILNMTPPKDGEGRPDFSVYVNFVGAVLNIDGGGVGSCVGGGVGVRVGWRVGRGVGTGLGGGVGSTLGAGDGTVDGTGLGMFVGRRVGCGVGPYVGA